MPDWARLLESVDHDPLRAQEIERELGMLPEHILNILLAMAHGDAVRAREIKRQLSQKWWERWLMTARWRFEKSNGSAGE